MDDSVKELPVSCKISSEGNGEGLRLRHCRGSTRRGTTVRFLPHTESEPDDPNTVYCRTTALLAQNMVWRPGRGQMNMCEGRDRN